MISSGFSARRSSPALRVDAVARDKQQAAPQPGQAAAHHHEHGIIAAFFTQHEQSQNGNDHGLKNDGKQNKTVAELGADGHFSHGQHRAPIAEKVGIVHD